jgi:hypothetical protein
MGLESPNPQTEREHPLADRKGPAVIYGTFGSIVLDSAACTLQSSRWTSLVGARLS